jgi:RimJ/RimL family protein N-acetyltransferase
MVILALIPHQEKEAVVGLGQYNLNEKTHFAELALVVRDDLQNQGIGAELQSYLTYLAKRSGVLGFEAEVLEENLPALRVVEKGGFKIVKREGGAVELRLTF